MQNFHYLEYIKTGFRLQPAVVLNIVIYIPAEPSDHLNGITLTYQRLKDFVSQNKETVILTDCPFCPPRIGIPEKLIDEIVFKYLAIFLPRFKIRLDYYIRLRENFKHNFFISRLIILNTFQHFRHLIIKKAFTSIQCTEIVYLFQLVGVDYLFKTIKVKTQNNQALIYTQLPFLENMNGGRLDFKQIIQEIVGYIGIVDISLVVGLWF